MSIAGAAPGASRMRQSARRFGVRVPGPVRRCATKGRGRPRWRTGCGRPPEFVDGPGAAWLPAGIPPRAAMPKPWRIRRIDNTSGGPKQEHGDGINTATGTPGIRRNRSRGSRLRSRGRPCGGATRHGAARWIGLAGQRRVRDASTRPGGRRLRAAAWRADTRAVGSGGGAIGSGRRRRPASSARQHLEVFAGSLPVPHGRRTAACGPWAGREWPEGHRIPFPKRRRTCRKRDGAPASALGFHPPALQPHERAFCQRAVRVNSMRRLRR